jgi:glycosyltransferase involved in cell wall biosynthesis
VKLLCLSTIDWHFLWQRHHVFMKGFAEAGWDVYFVENTGFRTPSWRDLPRLVKGVRNRLFSARKQGGGALYNPVPERVHVISPWVLPPNGRLFRWLNRVFFIPRLVSQLRANGLTATDLAFVYLPSATSVEILKQLQMERIVFDCVAHFRGHPDCPGDFDQIEAELLKRTRLVVTDSDFLYRLMKDKHSHVRQLHHGVDVELFRPRQTPKEERTEYRSLLFYGTIDDRIDWEAVRALHEAGARITMMGEVKGGRVPEGIVTIKGPLSHHDLAEEMRKFDAFLIPYRVTEFTNGIIPAKIFECMATEKPTLCAAMPSLERYQDALYLCRTPQEYVRAFHELAVAETAERRALRARIAEEQSEERNFAKLLTAVQSVMEEKQ